AACTRRGVYGSRRDSPRCTYGSGSGPRGEGTTTMTAPSTESATLGALLARRDLHLRLDGPPGDEPLARRNPGVHRTDLPDPTPFLTEDLVLLTTGTQFRDEDDEAIDAYVRRLRTRGVAALGFGTEVVREGIPAALAEACRRHGLPLFEVPY